MQATQLRSACCSIPRCPAPAVVVPLHAVRSIGARAVLGGATCPGSACHVPRSGLRVPQLCPPVQGQANSSLTLPLDQDLLTPLSGFDSIEDALADLAAGKMVVVLDDEDRENEGDLIMNADKVTTEAMAFIVEHTSGVVCIGMEGRDLDRLKLPLMVSSAENEEAMYTAFTVTVDLKDGITTGISASDRAKTIRHLANPASTPSEFRRPGHIFPLRYRPGGVLVRPGHTEASVDLARLSGSAPAGVLCEIVNKADGSMARTPQLRKFAQDHNLKCITIADLIRYRLAREQLVQAATATASMTTRSGAELTAYSYKSSIDGTEHLAFTHGAVASSSGPVLLHVHHERTVADLLQCGPASTSAPSLEVAVQDVAHAGAGVVLYMRCGMRPSEELAAMQQSGPECPFNTLDLRTVAVAAQMLGSLGVSSVRLAGGDEDLATALRSCGVAVQQLPVPAPEHAAANGNGHVSPATKPLAGAGMR